MADQTESATRAKKTVQTHVCTIDYCGPRHKDKYVLLFDAMVISVCRSIDPTIVCEKPSGIADVSQQGGHPQEKRIFAVAPKSGFSTHAFPYDVYHGFDRFIVPPWTISWAPLQCHQNAHGICFIFSSRNLTLQRGASCNSNVLCHRCGTKANTTTRNTTTTRTMPIH